MVTVSNQLTIADPICCYTRASKRKNPEIDILDMGLYALYTLVMLSLSFMLKSLLGVYLCSTLLVIILSNIYTLRNMLNDDGSPKELDESIYSDDSDDSDDSDSSSESEAEDSILKDFKKIVHEASEETAISNALDTATAILEQKSIEYKLALSSAEAAAADYNRVAREYSEIEKIIQGVAAEYRSKAAAAKEAALSAITAATEDQEADADADDAEARADAADEKEYNAD